MMPFAGEIGAWEVGAEVGNVKNNRPELTERVWLLLCLTATRWDTALACC
jgi:hypothetical protein